MAGRRATPAAVVLVLASACAGGASVAGRVTSPTPRTTLPVAAADPARLVGSWHLDASGEARSAILTIGDRVDGGLLLFRPCGMLSGGWRANRHGMFVGSLDGGDSACFPENGAGRATFPAWLGRVVGFRADGPEEALLDVQGEVVARLRPGGRPRVGPDASPEYAEPPVVTPAMRRSWSEPAALPEGVTPVTATALQHRWVPAGPRRSKAFVTFGADGSYEGSDGCNGVAGRFVLGDDGLVLATSGPSTLVGCENAPLPSWVAGAGRLGLRHGRLVFVDRDGKVLGEATRSA